MKRIIYHKDNLDILQGLNSESVDLIYLDPPFNKKKTFSAPIGSTAEGASFSDIFREEDVKNEWLQEIKAEYYGLYTYLNSIRDISEKKGKHYLYNYCYLCYMAIRLIEMKRILKDTGSIYYHCDQTMSHYIKILMDIIFGEKNFRNEIVWHYRTYQGKVEHYYPKKHDVIFAYTKNKDGRVLKNLEYKNNYQETVDYKRWKKYFVDGNKIKYNYYPATDSRFIAYLNQWQKINNRKPKKNEIIYECKGYVVDDVFIDIQAIDPKNKTERVGYPTQKPLALLERIIKSGSNEGDLVLDPFCGCATTCVASEKLNRNWIGIDVSHKAYELVQERMQKEVEEKLDEQLKFQWKDKIAYTTIPPKRTDTGTDLPKKYVYVLSHPMYRGYKVGIASDLKSRLSSYKTAHMDRNCKFEFTFKTPYYKEIETYIHNKYTNYHEWVKADLKELISEIENYKVS